MMRIATPETVWPRHFFNRLNKMQTRASKINEAKNDASKPNAEGANDSDEKTSDNAGGKISLTFIKIGDIKTCQTVKVGSPKHIFLNENQA